MAVFLIYVVVSIGAYLLNMQGFNNMAVDIVLLVAGFLMLIKGADYFVDGAAGIADRFGIPQIVIGLTIVAFGTSAPEAAVSISSALKHSTDLAVGNVVGSNIMNILLILGVASCITVLHVGKNTAYIEIPFVIFITCVLVAMGKFNGKLDFKCGVILWALFIVFFVYLIISAKKGKSDSEDDDSEKKLSVPMLIIFTLCGMAGIVAGADVTVDSASNIAATMGMSERIIGLTIVAFGTSLPELVTSSLAAIKGNADIAIGNIVGSNIFNILFVLGTTALITTVNYDPAFVKDGVIAIATAVVLFLAVIRKKEINRIAGIIMLVMYAAYFATIMI